MNRLNTAFLSTAFVYPAAKESADLCVARCQLHSRLLSGMAIV